MFLPEDLDVVKRPAVVALGREFNFRFSHAGLEHYCWLGADKYVDRHGHAGFCVWLVRDNRGWFAEWNDVRFSGASPDEVVGELLVLNQSQLSPEAEMVEDLMTIVHCFSSRLYGLRNYKKALKDALK